MSVTNPNTKTDDTPLRYRVDELLVDVGRRCVSRDGVELEITGRSFELLLALIRASQLSSRG